LPTPAGAGTPYAYAFVDVLGGARFWVDPATNHRIASATGTVLVAGTAAYVDGAAPSDVPLRESPSLAGTGEPGVLLLASREAAVPCSGAIVRLAFADSTFADGSGSSTVVAGSPTGATADTSDGIPATSACLDTPSLMGVDSAGHVYFLEANPPSVRVVW
jgi:hypothetical protein